MESDQCSTESILGQGRNSKIKVFLEFNEKEGAMDPNLWDTMKAMLRGKFITLSAYIKKMETLGRQRQVDFWEFEASLVYKS